MTSQTAEGRPALRPRVAAAFRDSLREGYGARDLRADILAGLVVGVVAVPLSMALAVASGVPPQHGLYTAVVGGAVIALFGGSRVQVSGPTAAFVVVLAPIAVRFGIGGLLIATLMAGIGLVLMGTFKFGALLRFIPYPVTAGFTAGIAVVIATLQIKDLLGLEIAKMPETWTERMIAIAQALPTIHFGDFAIGALTMTTLLVWPKITTRVPAPLVGLLVGGIVAAIVTAVVPGLEIATIASRFEYTIDGVTRPGIPQAPPMPVLPWNMPGANGEPIGLSLELLRALGGAALAIATLGAIESLLSAVIADGMTGKKHDSDAELVAQGFGNIVAPFFGGFAATGALARTATNVRSGARSPVAAIVHAIVVLLAMVILAPLLGYLPMASLAALLVIVAWNMSEARHVVHALRVSPKSDVFVLLACLGLTVIFDMVVAVSTGVVMAALLFMRRMSEVSGVRLVGDEERASRTPLPKGVMLYEVAGPLFFGAAQKAVGTLHAIRDGVHTVILDLRAVPAIDATGLVNLESALARLAKSNVDVVLAGVQRQPAALFARAGIGAPGSRVTMKRSFDEAFAEIVAAEEAKKAAAAAAPPVADGTAE